jgi:hypothetical protein
VELASEVYSSLNYPAVTIQNNEVQIDLSQPMAVQFYAEASIDGSTEYLLFDVRNDCGADIITVLGFISQGFYKESGV